VQLRVVLLGVLAQLLHLACRRHHALLQVEHPGHDGREDARVVVHHLMDTRKLLLVPADPPVQVAQARDHLWKRKVLLHRSRNASPRALERLGSGLAPSVGWGVGTGAAAAGAMRGDGIGVDIA
jgi:hypothetical protein